MNDAADPPGTAKATEDQAPIYIGVAWPYANGSLHLGHVAGSLLPPDIFRRYMRMAGHDVLMVSGSDCHGTPILLQAEKEGTTPAEVVERFHADHVRALERLGIGFDLFTRTTTKNHQERVQEIFLAAKEQGFIEKRTQQAPFDTKAGRFLPDRYVEGTCPHCDYADARGDQCDNCGKTLDPQELKHPRSKLDPESPIEFRDTDHYFFLLSKLQPDLERYVAKSTAHWRPNTINFTQNWLREGLKDRAITRDLTWGVPIPMEGYDEKRIYVWFEAVCGYLTAAIEWADRADRGAWDGIVAGAANGADGRPGAPLPGEVAKRPSAGAAGATAPADAWRYWWCNDATRAYYFLGKDNIPFHTIIWPGILTAYNKQREAEGKPTLVLPYDVPANEFLNLSGQQFSKSRGVSIAVHDVLDRFQADAVRYYLSVIMPEQRDSDWTWDDFLAKVNDELVGNIGNFVHRTLSFAHKNLGAVPDLDPEAVAAAGFGDDGAVARFGREMAAELEAVRLKRGVEKLRNFATWCNQQMQTHAPWKLLKADRAQGEAAVYALLRLVKALAVYMAPYMPDAADKTWRMVGEEGSVHDASWADAEAPLRAGAALAEPRALFRKLEESDLPGHGAGESVTDTKQEQTGAATDGKQAEGSGNKTATQGKAGPPRDAGTAAAGSADDGAAKKRVGGAGGGDGAAKKKGGAGGQGTENGLVTIDEFARLQLRLATITSVEPHPGADKLLVMKLDVGDLGERQVVAGLKAYYKPEELVGQTVAFVANLKPAKLRGVESQGMILAADDGTDVAILRPHRALAPGSQIR